jgi:hypothetical protein
MEQAPWRAVGVKPSGRVVPAAGARRHKTPSVKKRSLDLLLVGSAAVLVLALLAMAPAVPHGHHHYAPSRVVAAGLVGLSLALAFVGLRREWRFRR